MSIRYKISFLFAILVTIILSLVSLAVYLYTVKERDDTFRTRLKNRALSTARVFSDIPDTNFSVLRRMDAGSVASLYDKSTTLVGYGDVHLYMYADKPGDSLYLSKKIIERAKIEGEYYFTQEGKKGVAVHFTDADNNFLVAVTARDTDGQGYLQQLKEVLLLTCLFSILLSFMAGLIFAGRLIRPLAQITGEVNLITSNNLSQRIQEGKNKDELTKLSQTFNLLLDRLQESFAIQRRFISNASHELSTPLTSISSQLEVVIQKKRQAEEYQDVIGSVLEDIRELQQLTRSLLDIAKAGSQGSLDLKEVRLDEVLLKVAADVQKLRPDCRIQFDFETFPDDEQLLLVYGNSDLLYIAFKNIVENGCKYSDDQQVVIEASFTEENIITLVKNRGDIIAESDIQNIFQPFFRSGSVKHKQGSGLGLTLTRRILSLHKGTIQVLSTPDEGTVFTIRLPNIRTFH